MKNFLAPPAAAHRQALEQALEAIARVFPVPASHRRDLPFAVRDLSRLLTAERGDLSRAYWSAPRNTAAYVHYFLPWNLYRLAWLLPGLNFTLTAESRILDLGSGPLTLILALWCFRPELRSLPLDILCTDVAQRPMDIGRAILEDLAGRNPPWRIHTLRAPLDAALGKFKGEADLILAGNVLNELPVSRHIPLETRLAKLLRPAARKLSPQGRLLLVEPGSRLGGKLISLARKAALSSGLAALTPCPHNGPCPMLEQKRYNPRGPASTAWCHFVFPASPAPDSLARLTAAAKLDKDGLALSAVFLRRLAETELPVPEDDIDDDDDFFDDLEEAASPDELPLAPFVPQSIESEARLRVISDLIRLPGQPEAARYVCCAKGLGLLTNAARIPSGGGVVLPWPAKETRDRKSGALMFSKPSPTSPA